MKVLIAGLFCLILSACLLAQDRAEEHYLLMGDVACDTILTITTDARLDVSVFDSSAVFLAGTNMHPGDTWDTRLPTGMASYDLTVWHEGAAWAYDLRVECPIVPTEEPDVEHAHSLGEYLTQRGIDPHSGGVVTAIPVRTQTPP